MTKFITTAALAAALFLVGAATASADPPTNAQDPCAHNPTTLCDGTVRVVVEDPGENCEFGGLKVTIQRGKLDGSEDPPTLLEVPVDLDEPPGPPEDPPDDVFFVCNGSPGTAGPPGPPQPGPPGPSGAAGNTTTIIAPPVKPRCGPSLRIGMRLYVPARLRSFNVLTLKVDTKPARLARVRADTSGRRLIVVPMRGRHCGPHVVRVTRRGTKIRPVVQVWTVGGHLAVARMTLGAQ